VLDLIEWVPISNAQARVANLGSARIWGVEQDLSLQAARFVVVTAQATYLDARDTSEVLARRGHQLPLRPRLHTYLRPQLRRLPLGRGLVAGAYVEGDLTAGAFFDPANTVPLASRFLLGAGVEVGAPRAGLRLVVSAKNLTDSQTVEVLQYPPPGRSFFLSLNWSHESTKE
jgi:outer membrane receptor protein involved in Fe transport